MTEIARLVRRLRDEPLSRNRHFDELSKPEAMRARRVVRWLSGLERDLSAGAEVEVRRQGAGYLLRVSFPAVRAWRESHLSAEEHQLLVESGVLGPPQEA